MHVQCQSEIKASVCRLLGEGITKLYASGICELGKSGRHERRWIAEGCLQMKALLDIAAIFYEAKRLLRAAMYAFGCF